MHEMAIALNLLEKVIEVSRQNDAVVVDEVEIEIGRLRQLVHESLQAAFTVAAEGTPAEQATLKIVDTPAVIQCQGCGLTFQPEEFVFACPRCHQANGRVLQGNDVILKSIACRTRQEVSPHEDPCHP